MIFLLNLLLALSWMALTGQFDPVNFTIGFILAYIMLRLVQPPGDSAPYYRRVGVVARFIGFYLKELFISNMRVARTVLSPRMQIHPAVIALHLDTRSNLSISLLANLITLTPGTLMLDISDDREVMYVHTMYGLNIEKFRQELKTLEQRVREVTE